MTNKQLARMIDISAVKADSRLEEVELIVNAAKEHRFIAVYVLPSFTAYAGQLLAGNPDIHLGGTVGFPSGASTTASKAFEAQELLGFGCQELDMVVNIGKLKSGMFHDVEIDIKKIVEVAGQAPVKVILEVSLLTEQEIQDGARIIMNSGAQFVKTGTGWLGATTFDHIRLIKEAVGNDIQIKVAGGVRNLGTLMKMCEMGVTRFGISYISALSIMKEYNQINKSVAWEA